MQLQKKLGEVLMKEKLEELRQRALEKIKSIEELDALNELG